MEETIKLDEIDVNGFDINRHLVAYMLEVPFFAEISRHLHKVATTAIPTAGISYNRQNDCFTLLYNKTFFGKLTNLQVRNTLCHEFYHFIFKHLTSRRHDPVIMHNIAADGAINSIIVDNHSTKQHNQLQPLSCGCIIPGARPIMPQNVKLTKEQEKADKLGALIASWPTMQCTEWYFASLQKFVQDNPEYAGRDPNCPVHGKNAQAQKGKCDSCGKKGSSGKDKGSNEDSEKGESGGSGDQGDGGESPGDGSGDCDCDKEGHSHGPSDKKCTCPCCGGYDSFDDHDGWDNVSEDEREYVQNKASAIVEKAVKHADQQSNGWGSIPASLREEIRRSVSNIVNWRNVLRNFVGKLYRGSRSTSIKKINKRYPYLFPGIKRGYNAKLLICVDESGSVGQETCELFFAEIASLTKRVDVDLVEFDCACDSNDIVTWKKNKKMPLMRKKCGGTCFDAPNNVANHQKNRGRWDGVLIVTDGQAPQPGPSRLKRGWVLGPGCKLEFPTSDLVIMIEKDAPMSKGAWR